MGLTKEQVSISRSNRAKARKYFGLSENDGYDLHHKDPNWLENDPERYIQWNPEDLIVLTHAEHTILHNSIRDYSLTDRSDIHWSEESKKRQSEARTGKGNPMYGRHHSDETKKKMSEAQKKRVFPKGGHTNKGQHWKLVNGKRIYFN